jgi:hypothetical protein
LRPGILPDTEGETIMTTATAAEVPLATHVRAIRATADLVEQAAIAGLSVWPGPQEIVVQFPEHAGDLAARAATVARLAALTGTRPAPDYHPGPTCGWIHARGLFAGHPVHIFTPVTQETAS